MPLGGAGHGAWAALGFRRLSILDRSADARQPMACPDTGDCLIFNGEIYNYRELREELKSAGIQVRSSGDTEVLLRALSTWEERALTRIEGMFALAFYQAKTRRLLLARDPMGMKPLYVATTDKAFVFASEVRAVRASGVVPDELDAAGIAGMLAYGAMPAPRTAFRAIRSFPAAAYQWINADVVTGRPPDDARRFWNFAAQPQPAQDATAVVTHVRHLLDESVRRHLQADVPVGVCLSGGIDSSLVAALARARTPRLTAFTIGFDERHGEDEFTTASATASTLDIRHVSLTVGTRRLPSQWWSWLASMDSPSIDGFNTYIVSELMAVAGTVVGLSGLGADELFGGYATFPRAHRLASLMRSLRFISPAIRATALTAFGRMTGRLGPFEKLADAISGDASMAAITLALRRTIGNTSLRAMGLRAETLGLRADYLDPPLCQLQATLDGDDFNTVSRTEMTRYMANTLLRDADANSMRHSREMRLPFLDLPLVEYVSSLPGAAKQREAGPAKALLRDVAQPLISEAVLRRPKTGFTLPIGAWMRTELREQCVAAIERTAELPFVDAAAVWSVWKTFLRGGRGLHWSRPMALVALGSYLLQPFPREPHAATASLDPRASPPQQTDSPAETAAP